MTEAIITGSAIFIAWIVGVTMFLARMQSKTKELESLHRTCYEQRMLREQKLEDLTTNIDRHLTTLKTDIKWIKKSIANGHPVPMNEDEEDD
jgi:hypothetical protein